MKYRLISFLSCLIIASCSTLTAQNNIASLPNGSKVILHADKTWEYYETASYDYDFSTIKNNQIPSILRQGISADKNTIITAVKMHIQGWRYSMPRSKSSQASWGNGDGRTTWWKGSWYNRKTNKYSQNTPKAKANGFYYGDDQNNKGYWRNGGSPRTPSKIEWLLSSSGGVKPY